MCGCLQWPAAAYTVALFAPWLFQPTIFLEVTGKKLYIDSKHMQQVS